MQPDDVERILMITAHPDDVDFGSAGSVAAWTSAGIEVAYCIITDGDAGGFDPAVPRSSIAGIRQAEQRAAGAAVGVQDIAFLGYPDGRLTVSIDLRRDLSRVIRAKRPQRVVCQSPDRNYQRIYASHPDHLAAGEASLCAVYPDARNPFAHVELLRDEGLAEWTVPEVWLAAHTTADRWVDITDTFDRKIEALRAHESQTAHMPDLEGLLRSWAEENARAAGFGPDRLAEGYLLVPTA